MTVDQHLTDIFNDLNNNFDKTLNTINAKNGELSVYVGGINNSKQRRKLLFGFKSEYINDFNIHALAGNQEFREFKKQVNNAGYHLDVSEIKDPIKWPQNMFNKAALSTGTGIVSYLIKVPFFKIAGAALISIGLGLTALRLSNVGKTKVTFDIQKPEV